MSMAVDLSTPLTKAEVEYLQNRGRYADLERAAMLSGSPVPEFAAGDGTGPVMRPLGTAEDAAGERERLLARLAELDGVAGPEADSDDDDPEPYEAWQVKELDAELAARKLPVTGNKQAKADALYADDEAKNQA